MTAPLLEIRGLQTHFFTDSGVARAVNGVDLVKWDAAGQIVEFKVMLRPLKAINLIHERMAAVLQSRH